MLQFYNVSLENISMLNSLQKKKTAAVCYRALILWLLAMLHPLSFFFNI